MTTINRVYKFYAQPDVEEILIRIPSGERTKWINEAIRKASSSTSSHTIDPLDDLRFSLDELTNRVKAIEKDIERAKRYS